MIPVGILTAAATSSFAYLLDLYPIASAAYSLRKLRAGYTGFCIQVKVGSVFQDIGFVNNVLDTVSLLTFCGVNTGYVTKWYDQSGNGNDISAASSSIDVPKIVILGVLQTQNSKPSINFTTISLQLITQISSGTNTSVFLTGKANSLTTGGPIFGHTAAGGSGPVMGQYFGNYIMQNYNGIDTSYYLTAPNTADLTFNITNQYFTTGNIANFFKNNTNISVSSSGTFGASTNNFWNLGSYSGALSTVGFISEAILYKSNQLSNRTGINGNINSFYTIF